MERVATHSMNIVVTGGSGGIGGAFVDRLAWRPNVEKITATYHRNPPDSRHPKVNWQRLDLTDEAAIRDWAAQMDDIDWLINAAGILHTTAQGPEKTVRHVDPAFFVESMRINTLPSLLLAKHLHSRFRHGRPAVFASVSAKVGSIEDNRLGGWFSYRASKAALNMCLKTLAIEWRRTLPNVSVAALHPGTTDTALSKPFQKNVPPEQLFSPGQSVDYLLKVLDGLEPGQSGQFLAFDGERLPW
jgi:NAD(P)-dependent dehydrogenase (short-subunit alcohol dehydrogenase family)